MRDSYDLAIIGGGINGCGIARDAAGRGYSVFLCEMNDLASGTSSRSTKLIHGGLRYLEHFDFRLVRESLVEREVLWRVAPHIVRPMRFVLPHRAGLRPAWMLRAGLFLYDHLGGRKLLPGTRTLDLASDEAGAPLKRDMFSTAFEYSDCWVDDARLVVLNARDAADRGADVRTRTRAIAAERLDAAWQITVEDQTSGHRQTLRASALVNASGPWVGEVLRTELRMPTPSMRLVEGAHIVVPKLFDHERAYLLQHPDGRVVFAIPYEGRFTLIGTTDRDYEGDLSDPKASTDEIAYLCETASSAFEKPVHPGDVVWSYSGVRPLIGEVGTDAKAVSRDYRLDLDAAVGRAPLLSIIGGKITTYRKLAEAVLDKLTPLLPNREGLPVGWTGTAALPGGDFAPEEADSIVSRLCADFSFLDRPHATRLIRAYGKKAWTLLGDASSFGALGANFGVSLTEAEVRYLIQSEWARTAEDVTWRRSKLGLHMAAAEIAALDAWMRSNVANLPTAKTVVD